MAKKPEEIVPSEREKLAEQSNLTHAQLAVWTAQQRDPTPGRFNRILLFDMEGRVDTAAFLRAFRVLIDSNDALRTVVTAQDEVPERHLLPTIEGGLSLLDFSAEADPDATLDRWLSERCSGDQFEAGQPLFQSALIRLHDQHYAWYLNQHQLITDAVSTALVCKRMADLYGRALRGELEPIVRYPKYDVYIDFERRHRESAVYLHSRSYWTRKLAEAPATLQFFGHTPTPVSVPLSVRAQPLTRRVSCALGAERSKCLRDLARTPGHFVGSLELSQYLGFATLLFAFVYRASGDPRLRIGAPFSSRGASHAFDDTVGLLSEVCPLQLDVQDDETFASLLQRLKKEIKTVVMHAQPGVSCAVADHPCKLQFDYVSMGCVRFRGLVSHLRWLNSGCGGVGAKLRLQVLDFADCDQGMMLQFELDGDSFDTEGARLVSEQFLAVVDAFLQDRDSKLSQLPVQVVEPVEDTLSVDAGEDLSEPLLQ
jgi:hypothetical protein